MCVRGRRGSAGREWGGRHAARSVQRGRRARVGGAGRRAQGARYAARRAYAGPGTKKGGRYSKKSVSSVGPPLFMEMGACVNCNVGALRRCADPRYATGAETMPEPPRLQCICPRRRAQRSKVIRLTDTKRAARVYGCGGVRRRDEEDHQYAMRRHRRRAQGAKAQRGRGSVRRTVVGRSVAL